MFKIYDLNMKEIPFPDGVIPLEIFVGSVGKERAIDTVDGRPGVVDYGFNYTDRPVSLFLRIKAADKIDFRLLRNEVFATFDVGSAFYVAESDVPSRVLKVVVDESYIPDRLTEEYADFDINCRTLESVFWETKYTTLELHDTGYTATAQKYGIVDKIDSEKVKYRFTSKNFSVYNAGNVTIQPENMLLHINVDAVQSSNNFTIRNKTTGEEVILKRESNGSNFRVRGMVISLGGITNIFRDTNRRFISLVPGDNDFEVLNGTFSEIRFVFKFLYK